MNKEEMKKKKIENLKWEFDYYTEKLATIMFELEMYEGKS